ncbi:MAG: hypothetical protein ABJB22_05975, partial [Verrucomicrobiota bacterium]
MLIRQLPSQVPIIFQSIRADARDAPDETFDSKRVSLYNGAAANQPPQQKERAMLIRILSLFVSTCLAGTTLLAADATFVGKWKLNPD